MSPLEFVLGSHLVSSAVLAAVTVIVFALVQREIRVRPDAAWSGDTVVGVAFAPLITITLFGAVVLGVLVMQTWSAQPPSMQELGIASGIGLFAALIWILAAARREAHAATPRVDTRRQTSSAVATG